MDGIRKYSPPSVIGMFLVVGVMYTAGCTGPRPIIAPDDKELSMSNVGQSNRDGFTLRAIILSEEQGKRLLNVDVRRHALVPVLFGMSNPTGNPCLIRRDHFRLRIGELQIEPAFPGRAAALLRDSSRSQGAAWAGYLLFGVLAAPSIDAADRKEAASVEAHREVIFSEAHLPPGGTIAGYLFFESPSSLTKVRRLEMELRISGNTEDLISVQLSNPRTTPKGEPME